MNLQIKRFETLLNLSAQEIYCDLPDTIDSIILEKIKKKYVNTCNNGMYVNEIVKIVNRGPLLSTDRDDGSMKVSVTFHAKGFCYYVGDILTDCIVINAGRQNSVLCSNDKLIINVNCGNIRNIAKGQVLTVKLTNVNCTNRKSMVTCIGSLYNYGVEFVIYYFNEINKNISQEDIELLKNKLELIDAEKKEKVNKKLYDIFNEMYYPFKASFKENMKRIKYKTLDFYEASKEIVEGKMPSFKQVYIFRHVAINKSEPIVFMSDVEPKSKYNIKLVDYKNIVKLFHTYLDEYLMFIQMLRKMSFIYENNYADYNNIWTYYSYLKKDLEL